MNVPAPLTPPRLTYVVAAPEVKDDPWAILNSFKTFIIGFSADPPPYQPIDMFIELPSAQAFTAASSILSAVIAAITINCATK